MIKICNFVMIQNRTHLRMLFELHISHHKTISKLLIIYENINFKNAKLLNCK
ncbi:hypothetical protein YC2023_110022 [Brassica napus]